MTRILTSIGDGGSHTLKVRMGVEEGEIMAP